MNHSATYSPEDNKLRLYPAGRLPKEDYDRARAAGFIWAPKQGLFVAPMWTPKREDFLLDLAGEIGDEDTSLVARAEERADRFKDYSAARADDADQAHKAVHAITDNIPLGQPILVGHHSEKRARRDAEKIENGMRRAIKMWDTAQYWKDRAAGAVRAAKYKERPDVRARRIKKIEADRRREERTIAECERTLKLWDHVEKHPEDAAKVAGHTNAGHLGLPRKEGDRPDFSGNPSAYDAITNSHPTLYAPRTLDEVLAVARRAYPATIARCQRWLAHYDNRLAYERAMLAEDGGTAADKIQPEAGGGCKCWVRQGWVEIQKVNKVSVTVLDNWGNGGADFTRTIPFDKLSALMPKTDFQKLKALATEAEELRAARKKLEAEHMPELDRLSHGRKYLDLGDADKTSVRASLAGHLAELQATDEPEPPADPPPAAAPITKAEPMELFPVEQQPFSLASEKAKATPDDLQAKIEAMRQSLKAGVQVLSAPQLFPTPCEVAARMVELAAIEPGHRILEPSAGTGRLIDAVSVAAPMATPFDGRSLVAVEVNRALASGLRCKYKFVDVRCADFLSCNGDLGKFDRILMNPPFDHGADIKHIEHALTFLKPGGQLVAVCANGPRQREALEPRASAWIDLPAGTFREQGTNVNTALVVIEG
jgi:protein-L-isoaspartate O-methyltransferase